MAEPWTTTVGVVYLGVFFFSGVACLSVIPRARTFDNAQLRSGLVGLLATTGAWGVLKTAFFVVPDPLREATYTVGLIFGFATVWAWLYFASVYTGRRLHANATLRRLAAGVFLAVVAVKLTNPIHQLYFTTAERTAPFRYLAIEHGVIHWVTTGLSYLLAAIGLFMIFEMYLESEYDTRPVAAFTGVLALPIAFDIAAILTPGVIDFIYAPVGVAVFAVGAVYLFGDRLLSVGAAAQTTDTAIIVGHDDRVLDFSPAAESAFPELDAAAGEKLEAVLPAVAAAREGNGNVVERDGGDEPAYYFIASRPMTVGNSTVEVLALTDVTDRERQRRRLIERERELGQRTELYRAVIAASFSFVFRIDLENRFSFASPSVETFLGYEPDELVGEPISLLAADEETFAEVSGYFEDVTDGESIHVRDHPVATRSGQTRYVDIRVVPIYDPSVDREARTPADIVGMQAMVRDVSQRRQREGLISVMNRVLRHNVRNELTVINGYAEVLAAELDGDAESNAETIVDAADRLLNIAESARRIEANRERSPELDRIDIVPIVAGSIDQLADHYPETSVASDLPETAVAETLPRIETALWELLENAAEHAGPEPTVTVTVTGERDRTEIIVADDGPGLPDEERRVLANGKEEPLVHGGGLGLYLAYWIVTSLDGDIEIPHSESGARIEITLPAASETP